MLITMEEDVEMWHVEVKVPFLSGEVSRVKEDPKTIKICQDLRCPHAVVSSCVTMPVKKRV